VELRPATEEENRRRDAVTFAAWGSPLALEQWYRREALLRAHPWCARGMQSWQLRDGDGRVLSSCETFRMASEVRDGGGEARGGHAYGVASVFTEERLRGHGYAVQMLDRVHRRVAAEDPAAQAFILFTEVGARIYERAGYAARAEWDEDWVFPPSGATGPGAAELVPEAELERALARAEPPGDGFLVWPSADQLDWHRERERFYATALGRSRAPGCGAEHPDGIAFWAGNLRSERLYILLLRARTPAAADALVEAARRAAGAAGLGAVHLWKCPMPEGWAPERSSGRAVPRDPALPMIHPLRPEVRPEAWRFIPRGLWI